jgi:hypothetical protein
LDAKAKRFSGSDLAVRLGPEQESPASMFGAATTVDVYRRGRIEVARQGVNMLAIDPRTFERVAFWDASFSDTSLSDVMDRLAEPPGDGPVPAVVVGIEAPDVAELSIAGGVDVATTDLAIDQVAEVVAFPGVKRGTPTVFLAASALDHLGLSGGETTEAWIRGDREQSLAALTAAGVGVSEDRRFDDVVDRASFLTVSWTSPAATPPSCRGRAATGGVRGCGDRRPGRRPRDRHRGRPGARGGGEGVRDAGWRATRPRRRRPQRRTRRGRRRCGPVGLRQDHALAIVAGWERPDAGSVVVAGAEGGPRRPGWSDTSWPTAAPPASSPTHNELAFEAADRVLELHDGQLRPSA